LVLAIHDASFPAGDDDVGRGSPYSVAAEEFFGFARGLGFTGVQLGPQGWMARANASPYDGMLFSRHPASIALGRLGVHVDEMPEVERRYADHERAFDRHAAALEALWRQRGDAWAADVDAFAIRTAVQDGNWLERDAATGELPPARHRFEQWL